MGNITFKQNCFGYALGYSTWVNDPSYIFTDDYDVANDIDAGYVGRFPGDVHGWKIVDKCDRTEQAANVKSTSEKYRVSEIFNEAYSCGDGFSPQNSTIYKKKP